METNNKHTTTPWVISTDGTYLAYYDENNEPKQIALFIKKEDGHFAVTACNRYESLKQQNEEYRAMLALIRDCYKTDAKGELDRGNTTMFNYYQNQASHIDNLLTKYQK